MRASVLCGVLIGLISGSLLAQDDGEKLQSGIKVGDVLPGPFDAFNINGKIAKGRQHCLVCDYGLNPVVLVFAREPADGKESALTSLLGKLDDALERYKAFYLGGCAIFLSPDAHNSADNSAEQDPKKIVEEAIAREALAKRLEERAEKLRHLVIAAFPSEGPKGYHINPKAEVTVLFYVKHKVLANFAYSEGQMTESDVGNMMKSVDEYFAKKKPGR